MDHAGKNQSRTQSFRVFEKQYTLPLTKDDSETKKRIITEATFLFAHNGYTDVSIKDIARVVGIKPASLYNHFESKEKLWDAVLDHAKDLYILYFNELGKQMDEADTFEEILEIIFTEPKKMDNIFTCYAFGVIQMEQFYNAHAFNIYNDIFLEYSIEFFMKRFDACVAKGLVQPFDTRTVAALIMHSVLCGITASVQKLLGRETFYDPGAMISELQKFLSGCLKG